MDVLSLGKAKKVKGVNDRVEDILGPDAPGSESDVHARVSLIEEMDPKAGLIEKIGRLSEHTAVNLNKHNLRMQMLLDLGKSGLSHSVVDTFKDASGIDMEQSTGIVHDEVTRIVKMEEGVTEAELVLNAEPTETPVMQVAISMVSKGSVRAEEKADFAEGIKDGVVLAEGKLTLVADESGHVPGEGTYESGVIDLGENFSALKSIQSTSVFPGTTGIGWWTSTSQDGITFEEHLPLNVDRTIASTSGRYVKVKAILKADGEIVSRVVHDFTAEEAVQFEENEFVVFDGALKLKTSYEQAMTFDETYLGEGTLLKTVIDKSKFKKIEKLEVINQ